MAWILLGSFIYGPKSCSSNEYILWAPQYVFHYPYLLPKWTAPFFFLPNLTKISPLFVPIRVASESLMARMREHSLLCQPGLPLPCYFLVPCGLSTEIVFSLAIHQWDSQSHGQRGQCLLHCLPNALQLRTFTPDGLQQKSYPHPHPCSTDGSLLFLRQIHWLLRDNLWHKERDLASNQRSHQCVIRVSTSVCLCWGRAKS